MTIPNFRAALNSTGRAIVRVTMADDYTLAAPTGDDGDRLEYILEASGAARTITLGSGLVAPTGLTFNGVVASGSFRVIEIEKYGSLWFVVKNQEFAD